MGTKRAQTAVERAVMLRVRQELEAQGISRRAMAGMVGLSVGQLSDVLNGHKPASFSEVDALVQAVGLTLGQVVADAERGT